MCSEVILFIYLPCLENKANIKIVVNKHDGVVMK